MQGKNLRAEIALKVVSYRGAAAQLRLQAEAEKAMLPAMDSEDVGLAAAIACTKQATADTMNRIADELARALTETLDEAKPAPTASRFDRWVERASKVLTAGVLLAAGVLVITALARLILWVAP